MVSLSEWKVQDLQSIGEDASGCTIGHHRYNGTPHHARWHLHFLSCYTSGLLVSTLQNVLFLGYFRYVYHIRISIEKERMANARIKDSCILSWTFQSYYRPLNLLFIRFFDIFSIYFADMGKFSLTLSSARQLMWLSPVGLTFSLDHSSYNPKNC